MPKSLSRKDAEVVKVAFCSQVVHDDFHGQRTVGADKRPTAVQVVGVLRRAQIVPIVRDRNRQRCISTNVHIQLPLARRDQDCLVRTATRERGARARTSDRCTQLLHLDSKQLLLNSAAGLETLDGD